MIYVNSFKELEVYKLSRQLAQEIFEISKAFPKSETYSLTDQLRRSSRSIGAQIAEAWGKRKYERHFLSKLTDADAEQLETQHWLDVSADCTYYSRERAAELLAQCTSIGKMLSSMMAKSHIFCKSRSKSSPQR